MIRRKEGAIEFLQFEIFAEMPHLVHGSFLRHGGVSPDPFDSLNAGGNTGDTEERIRENRLKMLHALDLHYYVSGHQVHKTKVALIQDAKDPGQCDGLMTMVDEMGLMIKHADCQAAIFYDPKRQVVANVHCGWRGNVQNIYQETVNRMVEIFGCFKENIFVGISPSLGPNHAEFKNYKEELPENFWDFQVRPYYFDLWAIAQMQLEQAGILPQHIEIAKICTYEQERDCFSYRRDPKGGRNATLAALRLT